MGLTLPRQGGLLLDLCQNDKRRFSEFKYGNQNSAHFVGNAQNCWLRPAFEKYPIGAALGNESSLRFWQQNTKSAERYVVGNALVKLANLLM
jgi:hypothetical protein